QQRTNFAYGYVSLPFVWRNLGTKSAVIPSSGNVSVIVQFENLDLKRLAHDLGIQSTISGVVNARLEGDGTIADLKTRLNVQVRDGDLGLDVDMSGTFGHPVLSGAGDMTVNVARFTNATLPALRGFNVRCTFRDNALTLDRFAGDLAGGPFNMSGRVTFAKLTEPILDLQMRAQGVLVARNDTLTARADADVRITGPLAAATLSGNVALTNTRFL